LESLRRLLALYSREQGLRQSFEAYRINKERISRPGEFPSRELAQTRQQYESFRAQRIQALVRCSKTSALLRYLTGLPVEDGTRLVPIDTRLSRLIVRMDHGHQRGARLRPELVMARADLKARQFDLMIRRTCCCRISASHRLMTSTHRHA